jgi:hypothetical protein
MISTSTSSITQQEQHKNSQAPGFLIVPTSAVQSKVIIVPAPAGSTTVVKYFMDV